MCRILFLTICACLIIVCVSYRNGAPSRACMSMIPEHDAEPQPFPSPYKLIVSPLQDRPNVISVDLKDSENGDFKGFFIQARLNGDRNHIVNGKFLTNEISQHRNCANGISNALTHTNSAEKTNIHTEWTSPSDFEGEIVFLATVVKRYKTFWVGVESDPIFINRESSSVSVTETQVKDNLYKQCGDSKGCFGAPNDCLTKSECTVLLSYVRNEDYVDFEMVGALGSSNGWIAMALSEDSKMGKDIVTECIYSNQGVIIQQSWNIEGQKKNERINNPLGNIIVKSGDYENGVLTCKWKQEYQIETKGKTFDLTDELYHLLLAKGPISPHGVKHMHTLELSSVQPVNLTFVSIVQGKNSLLVKIHGSFMIATWLGLVGIGVLLARYYKQVWEGNTLCKTKMWFACHRAIMFLSVSLVIAGVVCIFIHEDGWSEMLSSPHPILGCVTAGLTVIQVIAGLARPNPNSSHRQVFNWLHFLNGNCLQILAVITIFFAIPLREANLPDYCYWILIGFIGFHFMFHLSMQLHSCLMDRKDKDEIKMLQLGQKRDREIVRDAPGGGFRRFMLGIYIVVVAGIVTAFILIIWLY